SGLAARRDDDSDARDASAVGRAAAWIVLGSISPSRAVTANSSTFAGPGAGGGAAGGVASSSTGIVFGPDDVADSSGLALRVGGTAGGAATWGPEPAAGCGCDGALKLGPLPISVGFPSAGVGREPP